ncbi:MAG: hypothetical protein WD278_17260 [Pirellulales bacterium]
MELDFAMLASNAELAASGNLHIFGGGFNRIQVPTVPSTPVPFKLVARAFIPPEDVSQEHWLSLELTNPSGERSIITERSPLAFTPAAEESRLNAVLLLTLVIAFKSYGLYQFHLGIDGQQLKTIPVIITASKPE